MLTLVSTLLLMQSGLDKKTTPVIELYVFYCCIPPAPIATLEQLNMGFAKNNSEKNKNYSTAPLSLRWKLGLVLLVFLFAIGSLSLVPDYSFGKYTSGLSGADVVFLERDFKRTPFALTDAHDACLYEVKSKLGERLLRSEMVPLSTRFNSDKGSYLVVLDADVGPINTWTNVLIYCDIDPLRHTVSFYRKNVH